MRLRPSALKGLLRPLREAAPGTSCSPHPKPCPCRNVKQYPEAKQLEGILIVRVDAPIYFANVTPLRDALL